MKVKLTIPDAEVTNLSSYERDDKKKIDQVRFDFKGGNMRIENHVPDLKEGIQGDFIIEVEGQNQVRSTKNGDFSTMVFNPVALVGVNKKKV